MIAISYRGFALIRVFITACSLSALPFPAIAQVQESYPEVVFSGVEGQALRDKAAQLGSAVAIYEYVHNTFEYSPYQGSRSGAVNTFLGQRGNAVDIASSMIAMLRSQGIPARYVVGTISVPIAKFINWLGINQPEVAIQLAADYGFQKAQLLVSGQTGQLSGVQFEHVWVEALVPFDQYRGVQAVSPSVDCAQAAQASRCSWIPLDGSFKQKTYNGLNLDPYNEVQFDYTAYYNAIKNNDKARKDKNPLTILEDQISEWLRTNHPGKTLADVMDVGQIIPIREGLLPASLPYLVVDTPRRYDDIATHDAVVPSVEIKKWNKTVTITSSICPPGTSTDDVASITVSLADITTKRLVSAYHKSGTQIGQQWRKGNSPAGAWLLNDGAIVDCGDNGQRTVGLGTPYYLKVEMDGAPSLPGGQDQVIQAVYNFTIGGYFYVAVGGETSNWSQVHRAAQELLEANARYRIVYNATQSGCQASTGEGCTPYVDDNGNGWDASDVQLLNHPTAMDELTGGLLYTAGTQYYAKARDYAYRANRLMKTVNANLGYLGIVSSVNEVDYLNDGTAFSIQPAGLLIDIKNMSLGPVVRMNEPTLKHSNRQLELLGHIGSSLEHEIWQELTGFDAVSTVRGFQRAMADDATLLTFKRNSAINETTHFLSAMGFADTAPAPFFDPLAEGDPSEGHQIRPFGANLTVWEYPWYSGPYDISYVVKVLGITSSNTASLDGSVSFDILKRTPASSMDPRIDPFTYKNDRFSVVVNCMPGMLNVHLNFLPPGWRADFGSGKTECIYVNLAGLLTADQLIARFTSAYSNYINQNAAKFNYLNNINSSEFVYRTRSGLAPHDYDVEFVRTVRDNLLFSNLNANWTEYLLPSKAVVGSAYTIPVDIRRVYTSNTAHLNDGVDRIKSIGFEISTRSRPAAGGYVEIPQARQ